MEHSSNATNCNATDHSKTGTCGDSTRLDSAHLEKSAQQDESSMDQPHPQNILYLQAQLYDFSGLFCWTNIQVQKVKVKVGTDFSDAQRPHTHHRFTGDAVARAY